MLHRDAILLLAVGCLALWPLYYVMRAHHKTVLLGLWLLLMSHQTHSDNVPKQKKLAGGLNITLKQKFEPTLGIEKANGQVDNKRVFTTKIELFKPILANALQLTGELGYRHESDDRYCHGSTASSREANLSFGGPFVSTGLQKAIPVSEQIMPANTRLLLSVKQLYYFSTRYQSEDRYPPSAVHQPNEKGAGNGFSARSILSATLAMPITDTWMLKPGVEYEYMRVNGWQWRGEQGSRGYWPEYRRQRNKEWLVLAWHACDHGVALAVGHQWRHDRTSCNSRNTLHHRWVNTEGSVRTPIKNLSLSASWARQYAGHSAGEREIMLQGAYRF